MKSITDIVRQQALGALRRLDVREIMTADHVAQSVLRQTVYWEKELRNGGKLFFVRFFSPVVQREEVFLGNILFNDFLSKAFARAVTAGKLGRAEMVANDLESYYFLVRTTSGLARLATAFRAEVQRCLPELFFGEQDEAKGIYGSLETMLDFDKANVEPFPVFIVPQVYTGRLEKAVRRSLRRKIKRSPFERNPTSIMANLGFFYSHNGAEMQSPYLFLARLALRYGIVDGNGMRQALCLAKEAKLSDEADLKKIIEESLKEKGGRTFSSAHMRELLEQAVEKLGEKVDEQRDQWLMPYIRNKFLPHDETTVTGLLLDGVSLGYVALSLPQELEVGSCRICGVRPIQAEDKSILMGQNTHRFHNQSCKQKNSEEPKVCLRCAACTYLMVKLMGSEAVGQPQVPKTHNLMFHYGRHTDDEVTQLVRRIDLIWDLLQQHRSVEATRRDIAEQGETLAQRFEKEGDAIKKRTLASKIAQKEVELQLAQAAVAQTEDGLFAACPWLRGAGASPIPAENPSLDLLANIQLSNTKVERHILGLGMGGYRMILYVLPQVRPPRDAKEHDFAQRRFSDSRVTVTALLAFLRELCGCDGSFYYQSLPALTPDAFQPDTFYVRNEPISVQRAQNEYELVTQLAWKLVWQRGSGGFVRKVILAEKLLEDPLRTFAVVMRDSAILGQTRGRYKRLAGGYREDWKTQDLTEYAKFIQRLSKLQEVD